MSTSPPSPAEIAGAARPPPAWLVAGLTRMVASIGVLPPSGRTTPVYVLVSGHDFRVGPEAFPEDRIDFRRLALARAERLVEEAPGRVASATVFDAASGTITLLRRDSGGTRPPEVRQEFGKLSDGDRYELLPPSLDPTDAVIPTPPRCRTLKVDQFDLLHILDVFDLVAWVGMSSPLYVAELSFFTHATPDGPQLFNSRDLPDHQGGVPMTLLNPFVPQPDYPARRRGLAPHYPVPGTTVPSRPPGVGERARDPCDRDGRGARDFDPIDLIRMLLLADGFASAGHVRLWGSCVSTLDYDLLLATRLAHGYRLKGLRDDDRLRVTPRLRATERWARSHLRGADAGSAAAIDVPFGPWRDLLARRLAACYAARAARVLGVPVHAALPGLWALPEPQAEDGMSVPAGDLSLGLTELALTYLGVERGDDERGYVRFDPPKR